MPGKVAMGSPEGLAAVLGDTIEECTVRKLILIKHALPEIVPEVPAPQWHLSEAGRVQANLLADWLTDVCTAVIVTSREPKATQTATILSTQLGCPYVEAENLHEHDRTNEGWLADAEFRSRVREMMAEPARLMFGLETADDAMSRFARGVDSVLKDHPSGNVAIVAHGTVISLLVSRRCGVDAFGLWDRLELPSVVEVEVPGWALLRIHPTTK